MEQHKSAISEFLLRRFWFLLAYCIAALPSALSAGFLPIAPAHAQNYPDRPIKVITSIASGGTWDLFVRLISNELIKMSGKALVIEPRPGGAWLISGRACAGATADGYTLCALSGETLVYPEFLNKNPQYDTQRDFAPIINFFFTTQVLAVHSSLKVRSLEELLNVAKTRTSPLAYVAPGLSHKMYLEQLNKQHSLDMIFVPFRGGADALNNIIQGTIHLSFFGVTNFIPYMHEGTIRGLLVDGESRSSLFPEIPTIREAGYKGPILRNYLGLVAPAGTPRSIIEYLNKEIAKILSDPEFQKKHMISLGLEPIVDSPEAFSEFLKRDRLEFQKLVQELRIEPQ